MVRRLTPEDYRGLTQLIYGHVNPYGRFDLHLDRRTDFEQKQTDSPGFSRASSLKNRLARVS
ncbi:hypothetical protein AJ87_08315 [Rhizobium yanglingense]|nr:hypothetical protein AJ87_08315 [Rhizobium yanglingense]